MYCPRRLTSAYALPG